MARSYEPAWSLSIVSFSLSVNKTGCLLILDGQILEYDLNLLSFSVRKRVGSCSRNFLKKGVGFAIFLPVISFNSSSIAPPISLPSDSSSNSSSIKKSIISLPIDSVSSIGSSSNMISRPSSK